MNIFDISKKYLDLISEIEDNLGDLTPELEQQLDITVDNFQEKFTNYNRVIEYKNAEIGYAKDEIDRLRTRINTSNNLIKRLKSVQSNALKVFGEKDAKKDTYPKYCG